MSKTWLNIMALCVGLGSANAWAATQDQIDTARAKGLWWLIAHQNGDGSWGKDTAAVASSATGVEAFINAGVRGPIFSRAYSWVANAPAVSVDSLARQIAAVSGAGGNVDRLVLDLLATRNSSLGWGSYAKYDTSFPDTALALNALLPVASFITADVQNTVCQILAAKRADGGWSYSKAVFPGAANSSIVPTVANLLAISAAQTSRALSGSYACGGNSISASLSSGVAWILGQKNIDNGFGAGGVSTALETAFAYQALKQLAPNDPATGTALDYLLGAQNASNGGWTNDAFQTALVMKVLPAPLTPLLDTDKDGIPDVVETLMGTNSGVSDSRGVASGNGKSVTGITVPLELVAEAIVGQAFGPYVLTVIGGTPPFTWSVVSGSLPPGLTLNASTGVISGTPTEVGSYSFTYSVTDSVNATAQTTGQINVYKAKPSLATGDINADGVVDAADVALAERFALGLSVPTAPQLQHADVSPAGNPDGVIDAADVVRIRLKALGLDNW